MNKYFTEFPKTSQEEWKEKLLSDLKGKPHELLEINDPIEEIHLDGYAHSDSSSQTNEIPGSGSFVRGTRSKDNSWANGIYIEVHDEKVVNEKALRQLMAGVDLLIFKSCKPTTDWSTVLNGIELAYIKVHFEPNSMSDYAQIKTVTDAHASRVSFCIDFVDDWKPSELETIIANHHIEQQPFCLVNGFGVQRVGGTSWQEIAYSLNAGHEYLLKLMDGGLSIDQAATCISFRVGVGANYFFSIAKIRALKQLWATIIGAYKPNDIQSKNCSITAFIGHTNKSLRDPHTNLLRQSTEAMAALSAGVDSIVILPHDYYSDQPVSSISERMAVNIPLVLKEESYFDKVLDPLGGSYSLEKITGIIAAKAWQKFQAVEQLGGILNDVARTTFVSEIEQKRNERIAYLKEGKQKLIGINLFMNPENVPSNWRKVPGYLGLEALVLEQHSNSAL